MLEDESLDYYLLESENSLTLTPSHLQKIMNSENKGIMLNHHQHKFNCPTPPEKLSEADLLNRYSFSPDESPPSCESISIYKRTTTEDCEFENKRTGAEAQSGPPIETFTIANVLFGEELSDLSGVFDPKNAMVENGPGRGEGTFGHSYSFPMEEIANRVVRHQGSMNAGSMTVATLPCSGDYYSSMGASRSYANLDFLPNKRKMEDMNKMSPMLAPPISSSTPMTPMNTNELRGTPATATTTNANTPDVTKDKLEMSRPIQTRSRRKSAHVPIPKLKQDPEGFVVKPEPELPDFMFDGLCPSPANSMSTGKGAGRGKRLSSTSSVAEKKPKLLKIKKYEQDPTIDPTVKNAIAAKINRTKKKREFEELKSELGKSLNRINIQENLIASMGSELNRYKRLYEDLKTQGERRRGINAHMTSIKEILEAIVPALNKKFQNVTQIELDQKLSNVMYEVGAVPEPRMENPPSSYFTFHYSPVDGKIKLAYDPDVLDRLG